MVHMHCLNLIAIVICDSNHKSQSQSNLDDHQITHPICVRLRHLLYDFLFYIRKRQEGGPKHPLKSHIANVLGGHRFQGQLRSCCVLPCFAGISAVLRSWNPNSPFALLRPPQMARLHFKNHIGSVIAEAVF